VNDFYEPLTRWQPERLAERSGGYSLDFDSTVFERYGQQEGARKGYNPKKNGRPSHHRKLAIFGEAHFFLHGWLRSGNCSASRGAVEFLKEALVRLGKRHWLRVIRGDSGFFEDPFLKYLEGEGLAYIVVVRLTRWIKSTLMSQEIHWREMDGICAVGEFRARLQGWQQERRVVVVRERMREKPSLGRKLFEIPGYTFRMWVTTLSAPPEDIWRDYNQRSDMERRIAELKYDLAADDFCLQKFYAKEAAFRVILFLFNLLREFQPVSGMAGYRQPATLRTQIFLCGAVLGRAGRRTILHLSSAWGGLQHRKAFLESILSFTFPTSPKLPSLHITGST
jgi:hypothetical protein